MTNKKLGLLLLPLIPLSALGIVEVVHRIAPPNVEVANCVTPPMSVAPPVSSNDEPPAPTVVEPPQGAVKA